MTANKHIFAIYAPQIDTTQQAYHMYIDDDALVKRITKVLRLHADDQLQVFGQAYAAMCHIVSCSKKQVILYVDTRWEVSYIRPQIVWYIPVAEKTAFEDAISYATVLGISHIYPIITDKSKRSWGTPKDFDRINRVIIAAAEQSKQFALPRVHHPCSIYEMPVVADCQFVCDPHGASVRSYLECFYPRSDYIFAGLVGPEGGLTDQESAYLARLGWQPLCLVSSVLRMETAVAVGAGTMRSLLTDANTPVSS